jgi:hypothetical protein
MRCPLGLAACLSLAVAPAAAQAPPAEQHQHAPAQSPMAGAELGEADLPELGTGPSVQMSGALGDYSMMRDASGTSWQPDSTVMEGIHGLAGEWATMIHGMATLVYDHQGGPRGGEQVFSQSMFMAMAQRQLGPGRLSLRGMWSLDPFMGKAGYPLLFQTGETADGVDPLIDRQHPHDFFMELAGVYSLGFSPTRSAFLYLGYPGEPALGPPTFMHRFSGMENPEAPLGHHWLDATHIVFGVATLGWVSSGWKFETSVFNGREPDQKRWDMNRLQLDSVSGRVSWNPDANWSLQASHGFLKSPEQLEPNVNQHRTTASAIHNLVLPRGNWQTTLAWGRNNAQPGAASDAFLLESAISYEAHTVFGRAETGEKSELFPHGDPLHGMGFTVSKLSLGYVYDVRLAERLSLGLGGVASLHDLPAGLEPHYGASPKSTMLFTRLKLR